VTATAEAAAANAYSNNSSEDMNRSDSDSSIQQQPRHLPFQYFENRPINIISSSSSHRFRFDRFEPSSSISSCYRFRANADYLPSSSSGVSIK